MSFSFNNPLIIGDINKGTKADIAQLQQDVGDLSQLDTADKSSLVNALNEAMDSTLNGASRDLDNLSDTGNDKLRSLNAYSNEGELLQDADGLSFVKTYAHSTFDRSKFTITGSPTITGDGVASGFSSGNYITTQTINLSDANSWEINVPYKFSSFTNQQRPLMGYQNGHEFIVVQQDANRAYIGVYLSSTGSSFDIMSGEITDKGALTVDTDYIITIKFTGTQYLVYVNGVLWKTVTSSTKVPFNSSLRFSGIYFAQTSYGSVDLSRFSITVDGVEVFSGNKTGIDTIKPDNYTIVGTPTISADGIASGFSSGNFLKDTTISFTPNKELIFTGKYIYKTATTEEVIYALKYDNSPFVGIGVTSGLIISRYWAFSTDVRVAHTMSDGDILEFKVIVTPTSHTMKYSINGVAQTPVQNTGTYVFENISIFSVGGLINTVMNQITNAVSGSIDLNSFKIYVDGNLVYQSCLKIPFTESKTGSKIVNSVYRNRVNDMAEQFGYANYYTLDEDNGNFTLPQVELYGLIGQRTLRDSYRNGDTYWELWSDRTLEVGGSCTSGVEYNLPKNFASATDYVLSVPYSAKTASSFTPTVSGDFIAKGLGVL